MNFIDRLREWLRQFLLPPQTAPVLDPEDLFWDRAWKRLSATARSPLEREYLSANVEAIAKALRGLGPDARRGATAPPDAGARIVFNISSAYIREFCKDGAAGKAHPYKNCYDLKHLKPPSPRREAVDMTLPTGAQHEQVYFAAAELNGAGIRYYGDICLVLKPHKDDPERTILQTNSYDLIRRPFATLLAKLGPPFDQPYCAKRMSGSWRRALPRMAAVKLLEGATGKSRRLTTAMISRGLLDDEDYIEVLWTKGGGSFGPAEIEEARVAAGDVVLESDIYARARRGAALTLGQMLWARRRREAARELEAHGVKVRAVAHVGRARE